MTLYTRMELCMQQLCSLVVLAILYLPIFVDGSSNDVLVVKQPELLTAELGGSLTINCTFEADYNTYSVMWFLGCENKSNLLEHPCYKHRVRFDNNKRQVIISNLTESDSGMYCCNVEVANGKKGAGNGTQVEVKQSQCKTEMYACKLGAMWLSMEVLRISALIVLIVLVTILIRKSS